MKTIYLAGGCFWGMEKALQQLDGVKETTTGYANGNVANPTYQLVCTDTTEFRETVRVEYDPAEISLQKLLKAYFICIDPTVRNQQGHDIGSQYQTGVYYVDDEDVPVIAEAFENEKKKYDKFYVELKKLENFYDAEEYHQDYLIKNPNGYCHISLDTYRKLAELNKD